uniref:monovalent cation/H(+) antiporter subunit G n=1 Tax=Nocardia abscessus TaxID=120957 RepID=UPI002458FE67
TRMHAATKPQVVGLILVLVGAALQLRGHGNVWALALVGLFTLVTAPVPIPPTLHPPPPPPARPVSGAAPPPPPPPRSWAEPREPCVGVRRASSVRPEGRTPCDT